MSVVCRRRRRRRRRRAVVRRDEAGKPRAPRRCGRRRVDDVVRRFRRRATFWTDFSNLYGPGFLYFFAPRDGFILRRCVLFLSFVLSVNSHTRYVPTNIDTFFRFSRRLILERNRKQSECQRRKENNPAKLSTYSDTDNFRIFQSPET